jgi:cephalosporin-C deacetylase-like acetyl esterase
VGSDKTLYQSGEAIVFRVISSQGGAYTYTIQEDRYTPVLREGTIVLSPGVETQVSFQLDYPGFLMFTVRQGAAEAKVGVGVDACDIQPIALMPADFDAFWDSLKRELALIPINPQVVLSTQHSDAAQTTYRMTLDNIEGKKVHGWISIPNCPGPFSAVLTLPPFGSVPVGPSNFLAVDGIIAVDISIHDYDCEQFVPASIAYQPNNHFLDRETNYYKAALLGCVRAIDYLFTRPEFNGVHLATTGVSQGGALALMVAGIDPRVKYVTQAVMALSNHAGFASDRSSGFPYWVREGGFQGAPAQQVIEATGYYDAVNFARRYRGPSQHFVGYDDEICPPTSVFAVYNQLTGPKTMYHSMGTGHTTPPPFWSGRMQFWMDQGIPFSRYWLGCPPVPAPDNVAPGAVLQLENTGSGEDWLTFGFLSTGNNGQVGTAYAYDIRYSTQPLDVTNFASALPGPTYIYPQPAGTPQVYELTGLEEGTLYYLGIRASDVHGNIGPMAVAQGTTKLTVSSTAPTSNLSVRVYPNPVDQEVFIDGLAADIMTLAVLTDVHGRIVLQQQVVGNPGRLTTAQLPAGVYQLLLSWGDSGRMVTTVVIKH